MDRKIISDNRQNSLILMDAAIRLQKLEAIGGLDALAVLAYGRTIAELPKDITAAEIRTGAWQLLADALEAETIARRPLPSA